MSGEWQVGHTIKAEQWHWAALLEWFWQANWPSKHDDAAKRQSWWGQKLKGNPGRCLRCCRVHSLNTCSIWWRTMVKPSPPGVCWSLHFLKNVGRGLTISVTITRGAAPAGSAAPEHGGQPKAPCTRSGSPPLAVFPRMLWSCIQQSRREWGLLLLPINQRKADFIPCTWHNPDVNTALHVCSYQTSARKGSFSGDFRKLKNSTSFMHRSPPHSLSGSSSCLWPLQGVPRAPSITQHPVPQGTASATKHSIQPWCGRAGHHQGNDPAGTWYKCSRSTSYREQPHLSRML